MLQTNVLYIEIFTFSLIVDPSIPNPFQNTVEPV